MRESHSIVVVCERRHQEFSRRLALDHFQLNSYLMKRSKQNYSPIQ